MSPFCRPRRCGASSAFRAELLFWDEFGKETDMKQLIGFWRDECDLLQRILIAVLAGMIVVFGVLTVAFRFHQGVEFDGALLKKPSRMRARPTPGRN